MRLARRSRSVWSRITSVVAVMATVAAGAVLSAPMAAATETLVYPDGVEYSYDSGNPAAGATAIGCAGVCPDPLYILDSFHVGSETYPVVAIGKNAFDLNGLTEVEIGDNVQTIDDFAFYSNHITKLTIGDRVETIGDYAFFKSSLTNVALPLSVETIGFGAFGNNQLKSVTIPNSVTTIGPAAFSANKLTSVTIGTAVTNIGPLAFSENMGLVSVVLTGPAPKVTPASDSDRSFETSSGSLALTYPWRYDESEVVGGYTSPYWMGYVTKRAARLPCHPFPDVDGSNVHCRNIEWLAGQGITKPADGNYHPTSNVTRGSMAAFLFRLTHPGQSSPKCTGKPFPDVKTSNVFCGYIQWAATTGVAKGYPNGTFRPGNGVTRGAMAAFMQRIAVGHPAPKCTSKPFNDVAVNSTFCKPISWMKTNKITFGVGGGSNYGTTQIVNRQSMASFLHRIYNYMH